MSSNDLIAPAPELPDDMQTAMLRLPKRISNALSIAGLKTVGEVRNLSDTELLTLPNVGKKSVDYIRVVLGLPSNAGVQK